MVESVMVCWPGREHVFERAGTRKAFADSGKQRENLVEMALGGPLKSLA